jgi:hypothetical protein
LAWTAAYRPAAGNSVFGNNEWVAHLAFFETLMVYNLHHFCRVVGFYPDQSTKGFFKHIKQNLNRK